ncbi:MAG: hypothetical protein ACI952_002334 [Flavobacteriales bacterium]
MRVFAVPKSIDKSLENMPRNFLNIRSKYPTNGAKALNCQNN